ncbi:hypothetical protein ACFP7A_04935 [Sporolactobacillus kofuensis]|uniref:Gram-positive cocci surface proteins LPxTG domain-containing protein n=1 Tax=Sporolactobacillus kofuensis TaxID=269672 RepID=A0ABW1WC46_9BACL|nr:hypothetical protein [Sporolactobacillus kofuensis]MCO7174810.1 hypothetical protein [Sporolactobacillus kofuensis]
MTHVKILLKAFAAFVLIFSFSFSQLTSALADDQGTFQVTKVGISSDVSHLQAGDKVDVFAETTSHPDLKYFTITFEGNPSGYQEVEMHYDSESQKYVGQFTVPSYNDNGTWSVWELSAGNPTSHIYFSSMPREDDHPELNPTFQISGLPEDHDNPTVNSLQLTKLQKNKVKISIDASDPTSTVRAGSINAYFATTNGGEDDSQLSFTYNPQSKKYEAEAAMNDTGTWYVSYVSLVDQAFNRFREMIKPGDSLYSSVTITDSDFEEDSTDHPGDSNTEPSTPPSNSDSTQAPRIISVTLDKSTAAPKDKVQITVKTTAETRDYEIGDIDAQLTNKNWQYDGDLQNENATDRVTLDKTAASTDDYSVFQGTFTVPDDAMDGDWLISFPDRTVDNTVTIPSLKVIGGADSNHPSTGDIYKPSANTDGTYNMANDATFTSYVAQSGDNVQLNLPQSSDKKNTSVSLSADQVNEIKKHKNVTIETGGVTLSLPTANLGDTGAATISIAKAAPVANALTDVYEFTLEQNGQAIHQFKDKVTLTFHLDQKADNPVVYYIDNQGKFVEIDSKYENGIVYGYTSHFSKYTVMEKTTAASQSTANTVPTGSTQKTQTQNADNQAQTAPAPQTNTTTKTVTKSATGSATAKATAAPSNTKSTSAESKQILPTTGDTEYSLLSMIVGVLLVASGVILTIVLRRKHHAE